MDAELLTVDGKPVLRFERRLAHPPAKVWRAITDPGELKHWFPAAVSIEGTRMTFTFPDEAPVDDVSSGEVLTFDEPRVFAFRWNHDVLRFEIVPDGDGCRLLMTQVLGDGGLSAGRNAIGWDVCLDTLVARLSDVEFTPPSDWLGPMEAYVEKFGLGEGAVTPEGVRFERDLVWKPVADMWALLVEDSAVVVGGEPPVRATNGYVRPGAVTVADAPHVLEYEWLHSDVVAGRVRWEFRQDPASGTSVTLTQSVRDKELLPTMLAVWQVQLELFFAASFGEVRCPWPAERTEELRARYAQR
ncbi:hypothetical protein FKR81_35675 [Lentzea tibetensis]|uniref:Activator of Hsp90 ATPase homologue 1/2-like C-terminal domain-containing protein n=1 Tax=Lentzea tibetensis TaxID=2591470 RepID=A0A563EIT1_9PSEU|nr:SRPBCC family protein [Lentzea tibetensis]TWP46505.1 hypothetical protein FKR81_35675 [Lentzea tibetensis]